MTKTCQRNSSNLEEQGQQMLVAAKFEEKDDFLMREKEDKEKRKWRMKN